MSNVSFHVGPGIIRRGRESASGEKAHVKRHLSRQPRNYPSGARERVGRDWLRRPRYYPSGAALNTAAFVASAPELSVGGERAGRPCLVARERVSRVLLRRKERAGRDWLLWPRNYPSGEQARVKWRLLLWPRN